MRLMKLFICFLLIGYNTICFAQVNADSIKNLLREEKSDDKTKAVLLCQLSAYYIADSTNLALNYANEAYLLAIKRNDKQLQAIAMLRLSEGYLYNDIYDEAIRYGLDALDICEKEKKDSLLAEAYMNLGWVFYDTENSEFALQYHKQANELFAKLGNDYKVGYTYNAIGLVMQMKDEVMEAKNYFQKELEISKKSGNEALMPKALNNLGICENSLKNYRGALVFFEQARALKQRGVTVLFKAETLNQMAYTYLKLNEYKKAEELLNEASILINQSTSNGRKEKLLDNLSCFSELYKSTGRYKEAYTALFAYNTLRDTTLTRLKSEAVTSLKMKNEFGRKEEELRKLKAQKELRVFQRNTLGAGLILLIIIGVLLFGRLKQKQKREKEINEVKQALMKQELENSRMEKLTLDNKLEYKNSELKNTALYVSQKNELIREFIEEIQSVYNELAPQQKNNRFSQLLNRFNYNLEINKEAQEFNQNVEENHKDFLYNLLKAFPDLTENERRLCAHIRLNLSLKDIASLTNISVKSVEMARYRLRKHFKLEQNQSLSDFLKQF